MGAGQHAGPLPRGAAWGRYVILDHVGEGSMGIVYAAYDGRLDRRVALKLLRPESSQGNAAGGRARLLREAQAMARLSHPNVMAVYDAGEIEGEVHLAMEFVEGKTLRQWLPERSRSWREIVDVFTQAGRGLAAAHASGVVHRDFKPDNVLIDDQGRVRVTDFGLARPSSPEPAALSHPLARVDVTERSLTQTGAILGTPAYMAPEQLDGRPTDHRTDQFCFCVALYEALYRERPFAEDTLEALAFAKAMGKVRPPPRDARIPPWLRRTLLRGLASDPAERYPSMDGLLAALGRDPVRARRRWAIAGVAGALAIAGFATLRARSIQLCRAGPEKFGGVWDEGRRGAVERAFLGTGLPYAKDAFEGVRHALDGYVAGWLDMYQDACEATHRRGEQSAALLDLRMACLERRRQELRALVDVFAAPDGKVVENAVQAAHAQTPLVACADVPSLTARAKRNQQPERRKQVEAIEGDLIRVKALTQAGKFKEAIPLAEQAVTSARGTDDSFVLADALIALDTPVRSVGQYKRAEAVLDETVQTALASNNDETLAKAMIELMDVVGRAQTRHEEGQRWGRYAHAVVSALGPGHAQLEVSRLEQVSALLREQGKYEDALRVAQECLALSEKNLAKTDPAMAKGLNAIAIAHYSLGAYRQAADEWRQAAETLETALGPRHPALAGMMVREGFSLAEVRDPDSLRILRRAREILAPALGADSPLVASADGNLGMAMIQLGLIDDGRALFEHALTVFERTLGRASWSYAWALYWIGEAHFERGNLRSALRYAHQSWSDAEKLIGTKHPDLAYPLLTEGEAFLAQRDLARAIPLLERSLALREAASVAPDRKARSSFALARALVAAGHDPPRALELARRARDLYRQQAQGFERELQQVERWLSERPDERKITKARAP